MYVCTTPGVRGEGEGGMIESVSTVQYYSIDCTPLLYTVRHVAVSSEHADSAAGVAPTIPPPPPIYCKRQATRRCITFTVYYSVKRGHHIRES